MYFEASDADQIVDCAAALTALNRKQYHMTRKLKPLAYHVRAQCVTTGGDADPIFFSTAPNTWTTRNALVMFGAHYRKQLISNGLRINQLPTYGRELRYSISTGFGYSHGAGADGYSGSATLDASGAGKVLQPLDFEGAETFADYTNTDGTTVSFEAANDLTLVSIPEMTADGEPETVQPSLIGTSSHDDNNMAVIPEYLASRRNAHDHVEVDHDLPQDDSLLLRMSAVANEHFDDIVDAVEETGDRRPYNESGANTLLIQGMLGAVGDYCSFVAPCGLIRVKGNADSKYLLTVTAITEM